MELEYVPPALQQLRQEQGLSGSNRIFQIAIAVSLLLHGLLIASLMHWGFAEAPPPPPRMVIEMLPPPVQKPVEPPPPPEPKPTPAPTPAPPPKPTPIKVASKPTPAPTPSPAPKFASQLSTRMTVPTQAAAPPPEPTSPTPPGPPQHRMKAAAPAASSSLASSAGKGKLGSVYAPPDYAEKVKARVNAAMVYPADAKKFLQQCWIEYTLTVDRDGNMLDYKISNCGNDRLDAAARSALIKGGPFPPLTDTGASSYEIQGAFVYTLQ